MAVAGRLVEALADRFTIEREIGAGGMAVVYLARDLRHGRKVAIKVLRPELAESIGSERFLREIEIAAALTHPHILPLHDSGGANGVLYYVMPFIDGESLRQRLAREGTLPIAEATRIFRDVVDALGEAHRHGVVHRDVKPANVMLSGGHALVTDFGVARAILKATDVDQLTTMGVALGTPQYMAPEQATADPTTDHRADIFAAGILAYEMLTGVSPFAAGNSPAVFAALMTKSPEPPHRFRAEVSSSLSDLVMSCLEKSPDARPQSAGEVLGRLEALATPSVGVTPWAAGVFQGRHTRAARGVAAAAAVLVVGGGSFGVREWRERVASERWARTEAVPQVLQLADQNRLREAAELAMQAEQIVGADPILEPLWPRMTTPFRVRSDPPGADIWYRPYDANEQEWRHLGVTPFSTERFPVGSYRFRLEKEGFEPLEEARSFIPSDLMTTLRNAGHDYLTDPSYVLQERLVRTGTASDDMLTVPGGSYGLLPIAGFGTVAPIDIPEFRVDRTEVTNEAYLEFVAAGGYADSTAWREPFRRDDEVLTWSEAMLAFRDATGRAGPATWVLSRPPQGQEAYPVGGVSWFEAAAYCRWRGKSLPTLFHWARATLPSSDVWIPFTPLLAAASNLEGEGPEPAGSRGAIGISGAEDLAGNVREWVSTAAGADRYFAGGAWTDPEYVLYSHVRASPWIRFPTDGFRCVRYPEGEAPEHLRQSLDYPPQDLYRDVSIPDAAFEATRVLRTYDRSQPLAATVDSTFELAWGARIEWVSVDTPYGERLPIRLFLPAEGEPPFQAIVWGPGGNSLRSRQIDPPALEFLVRAGRAVVEPVLEGTFQRNDGWTWQRYSLEAGQSASSVELKAHWSQELGRTLDYLEQRPDIDGQRVAYSGISHGAGRAADLLAYEPRIKAALLFSAGLSKRTSQAEIDESMGLAHRVRIPILMLGGRYDFANPVEHQEALFRAFGTPEEDKRQRFYEAGHRPLPPNEVTRESVDFLDRYLGPVEAGR